MAQDQNDSISMPNTLNETPCAPGTRQLSPYRNLHPLPHPKHTDTYEVVFPQHCSV